jgi:hypothetical protein
MILTSSLLRGLNNQAFATVGRKFRFTNIIKSVYDDHTEVTGIFYDIEGCEEEDLDKHLCHVKVFGEPTDDMR